MHRFNMVKTIAVLVCVLAVIIAVGVQIWNHEQRLRKMQPEWAKVAEDEKIENERRRQEGDKAAAEFAEKQKQREKEARERIAQERERIATEEARQKNDERLAEEGTRKLKMLMAEASALEPPGS